MLQSYSGVSLELAIDITSHLISFDTESSKSNLELISWVEAYLKSYEVPYFLTMNQTRDKAALCATVGPMTNGGVVLSGHTDVVPVAGQAWTSDPYALRRADERLYGRGDVRHEGVRRNRAGPGADLLGGSHEGARPYRAELRRGGNQSWFDRSNRSFRPDYPQARPGHRWRADDNAGCQCPQKHLDLFDNGQWARSALLEADAWRQRQ